MKHIAVELKKKDNEGNDIVAPIHTFRMGEQEIVILRDCLDHIWTKTPRSLFTRPFTSRLNAMREEIHKVCRELNIKMPKRPKGWMPGQPDETF